MWALACVQAERATTLQIELQQRTLEMEAKAVELDRMQEWLQNELKDRTAELREEVCCLRCRMRTMMLHSLSVSSDHSKACEWTILPSVWQLVLQKPGDIHITVLSRCLCSKTRCHAEQTRRIHWLALGVLQTLLRQAEQAARREALTQVDALREEAAAAAEEKGSADAALTEMRSRLQAASTQVSDV